MGFKKLLGFKFTSVSLQWACIDFSECAKKTRKNSFRNSRALPAHFVDEARHLWSFGKTWI